MTPIPPVPGPDMQFDPLPIQILGLILMITVLSIYAAITWLGRHGDELRKRLFCPVYRRMAKVTFLVAADGKPTDVVRCSVFGRRAITCCKACLAR